MGVPWRRSSEDERKGGRRLSWCSNHMLPFRLTSVVVAALALERHLGRNVVVAVLGGEEGKKEWVGVWVCSSSFLNQRVALSL